MKFLDRPLLRAIDRLNGAGFAFGLGGAVIISIFGVVIASAVAYYYSG